MYAAFRRLVFVILLIVTIVALWIFYNQRWNTLDHCINSDSFQTRHECLTKILIDQSNSSSPTAALQLASDWYEKEIISDCHLLAHEIGEYIAIRTSNIGDAFSQCANGCSYGCYHGVVSQLISPIKPSHEFEQNISLFCQSLGNNPAAYDQCVHGIGHGLLAHGYFSLKDAAILCRTFPRELDVQLCLGGVYMENMSSKIKTIKKDLLPDLALVCNETFALQDEQLNDICVYTFGEGLMLYTNFDIENSTRVCEQLGNEHTSLCHNAVNTTKRLQDEDLKKTQTN